MIYQVNPNNIFEQNPSKGGVCLTKTSARTIGVGLNTSVITAVPSKKILVIGLWAFTATGTFNFKDGSGGGAIMYGPVPGAVVTPYFFLPNSEIGYFETSVNTDLVVDVATAVINFLIRYIEYVP